MSAPPYVPPIRVRGIRQNIPPGYVIGRISNAKGRAELIPFSKLAGGLNASTPGGQAASQPTYPTLVVNAAGLFTASQQLSLAAAPSNINFPSAKGGVSTAYAKVMPTNASTCYLVSNLLSFLAGGPLNGVLATIVFAAPSRVGVITWYNPGAVYAGAILTLVMPATADPSFSGVTFTFLGDAA